METVSPLTRLVTRTGAFAMLKEKSLAYRRSHFSEPLQASRPKSNKQKRHTTRYAFSLVDDQGLEAVFGNAESLINKGI